ncbi:uncharacterized protein TNCV_2538901 [Trichonephila clavipes]|nr:uncharacterized protein TNCV_2538901 [Trichonephila clavipes]
MHVSLHPLTSVVSYFHLILKHSHTFDAFISTRALTCYQQSCYPPPSECSKLEKGTKPHRTVTRGGQVILVDKVMDTYVQCHEFEPTAAEDPPSRGGFCMLIPPKLKCPPNGVMWKLGQELWFQQYGATCHTARATIDLLKDTFGDRLISRFGPVNWPPRSCDLTPLDYFLWGYVKSLVYADKPQTPDHLEDNIRRVIADIRPQMFEKVIENWTSRLDYIRARRGSHMPEIIFKITHRNVCTRGKMIENLDEGCSLTDVLEINKSVLYRAWKEFQALSGVRKVCGNRPGKQLITCVGCIGENFVSRLDPPGSIQSLKQMLIEECAVLPQELLDKMLLCIERRCKTTIVIRGGHFSY